MQARFSETAEALIKPYLDIVRAFNPERDLKSLSRLAADRARAAAAAGSPDGVRGRTGARKRLMGALRRDTQARVVDLDGWLALPAFVPPNERRGLVLIDPPLRRKTSSNGWPAVLSRRSRNGRPAATCCGIR